MNPAFNLLYKAIATDGKLQIDAQLIDEALRLAGMNKVSLQFMRAIDLRGNLREAEEKRLSDTIEVVKGIVKQLKDLDYTFYKLIKPVAYVPADVDILIKNNHVRLAISKLKDLGFKITVVEPYCITMRSPKAIVDLYLHPTIGGMIYLDAESLLEYRTEASFHGLEVPSLKTHAEALLTIAHALYKEMIYTLNDYVTVKDWMNNKTLKLAEELNCKPALKLAVRLNKAIGEGELKTPYKLPITLWIKLVVHKLTMDRIARATSKNLLYTLTSRRGPGKLTSKLTRGTY